jgi:hypothetical protein
LLAFEMMHLEAKFKNHDFRKSSLTGILEELRGSFWVSFERQTRLSSAAKRLRIRFKTNLDLAERMRKL